MKKYIYYLYYEIRIDKGLYKSYDIGYFSSRKKAKMVRKKYRRYEGFKENPKCFCIKRIKIDKPPKKTGIKRYI